MMTNHKEPSELRWWESGETYYYKAHINSWGPIKGTWRFIVSYVGSRKIIWYPLWKIIQCFYAVKNALFGKHKPWRDQVVDDKNNKRVANGLASVLMKKSERHKQRVKQMIKQATPVDQLPQVGGVDSEEYDESCILSLKAKK